MKGSLATSVTPPDLRALLIDLKREIFSGLNCVQIGTIQAFDADKQKASVSINVKRRVYNKSQQDNATLETQPNIYEYPVLVDCPVFVLSGGAGRVEMPVAVGDSCLVLFSDRDIDIWYTTGATAAPNSARMHDLSDGIALVGVRPLTNTHQDYPDDAAGLRMDDTYVRLTPGGASLEMGTDANLSAPGDVEVSADGDATMVAGGAATMSAGGNVVLDAQGLLDLHNQVSSMYAVMTKVVAALTKLNSVKSGGTAATEILAVTAEVAALLKP